MSDDDGKGGDTEFITLKGPNGETGPAITREAFDLHRYAITTSVVDDTPGFVSDDYLDTVIAGTTTAAAELCLADLWERVEHGYRIIDQDVVDIARLVRGRVTSSAAWCDRQGGHTVHEHTGMCSICFKPLGPEDVLLD
ncbi:MAG: hypothetical protein ABWY93_36535 [Mycobacterium sp.]